MPVFQPDVENAAAVSETTPMLKERPAAASREPLVWATSHVVMICVNALVYVVGIIPLALPSPMAPSLEADFNIGWGKRHTQVFLSQTYLLEGVGLLLLGWLPDMLGGANAMAMYLATGGFAMLAVVQTSTPWTIITIWGFCALVRGMAWTAAMKINDERLPASQFEVGLFCVAMASRFGDSITAEIFGSTVKHIGWRGAILGLGFVMLVASVGMWVADAQTRTVEARETAGRVLHDGFSERIRASAQRLKEFYSMRDTWLILVVVMGQQPFWTFSNYLATFAHQIYEVRTHSSAIAQGLYPAGQFVALSIGLLISVSPQLSHRRKKVYVLTTVFGMLAAIIPWFILYVDVSVEVFLVLGFLQGFTTALIDYLPVTMWCQYVGGASGDVSLYLGVTLFFTYCFSFTANVAVGYWRQISEQGSFDLTLEMACVGGIISVVAMLRHVGNHWSTDFLDVP